MENQTLSFQPLVPGSGQALSGQAIADLVRARFSGSVLAVTEHRGQTVIEVKREDLVEVCRFLHDEPALWFDYLSDVSSVDNLRRPEIPLRFESTVYLYSIPHNHRIAVRVRMPEEDPSCPSVSGIWRGANWHERESYDLMGITYTGHPDLRRIMMPDGWSGHPLRKDYPLGGVKSFFYKRDSNPHYGEPPGFIPRIRVQDGDI